MLSRAARFASLASRTPASSAAVASHQPFLRNMSAAAAADAVKHWAVQYTYVPDVMSKRAPLRPAHLQLASEYKAAGKMLQGGAFTEPPMGALLTFYTTRAEVDKFVAADPYVNSGANSVVTDVSIREWSVVVGSAGNPNYAAEPIQVGQRFPAGQTLFEGNPGGAVNVDQMLKGKKVVIFGVPGAFTPGCSKTHLPGYVADAAKLKAAGIDEIVCVSINDAFVMAAWGEANQAEGKVRMLADSDDGKVTKRLGLAIDLTSKLCSVRSKRYSLIVDDGVVVQANIEPESAPTGLTCSLASAIKLPNKL